jgi:hypothetical protein
MVGMKEMTNASCQMLECGRGHGSESSWPRIGPSFKIAGGCQRWLIDDNTGSDDAGGGWRRWRSDLVALGLPADGDTNPLATLNSGRLGGDSVINLSATKNVTFPPLKWASPEGIRLRFQFSRA